MTGKCIVPKCEELTAGLICSAHWHVLSMGTRKRYWTETDYGLEKASEELKQAMIDEATSQSITSQSNISTKVTAS